MACEYSNSSDTAPDVEPKNPEILHQAAFNEAVQVLLEERSIIGDRAQVVGGGSTYKPGIRISNVNNGIATLVTDYPEFFTAYIQEEPFEARHAAVISAHVLTERVVEKQLTLADTDESARRLVTFITACVDRLNTVDSGKPQQVVCENSLAVLNDIVQNNEIDQDFRTLAHDAIAHVYQTAPQTTFEAILKRFNTFSEYYAEVNASRLDGFTASFSGADINVLAPDTGIVADYRAEQLRLLDIVANEGIPYTQRLWAGKLLETLSAVFPNSHKAVQEERKQETIEIVRKSEWVA